MRGYLYGDAALEYFGVPALKGKIQAEQEPIQDELIFFTDKRVHLPGNINVHTCRIEGAEKYTSGYSSSLPLAYMQVANKYNEIEHIYLGMQIVSGEGGRPPLCKLEELEACALDLKRHRGRQKVLKNIKFLEEGSRSPMESLLYMLLRLPVYLGGCGFDDLVLNHKIKTSAGKTYFADIFWEEFKLVIEYQGERHLEKARSRSDRIRKRNLEADGYTVIEVWKQDVFNLELYKQLIMKISRHTGHYVRIRTSKYVESFAMIREILKIDGKQGRTAISKVFLHELPPLRGVFEVYQIYLELLEKLRLKSFKDYNIPIRRRQRQFSV